MTSRCCINRLHKSAISMLPLALMMISAALYWRLKFRCAASCVTTYG
ncbi:hypothetical protein OG1X_1867 [Enterococcus faecalis OG1X]|nr:hypothetical protein OG1X_1867 [Enterococcus faecalis OG1X]